MTPTPTIKQALTLVVVCLVVASTAPGVVLAADDGNDTREDATTIDKNTQITDAVADSNDADWFKFEADRGEAITVTVNTDDNPDSGSISVYLLDLDGNSMDRNLKVQPDDPVKKIGGIAERTGTYYVLVDDFDGETNSYSFEVDTRETDGFEPNEEREKATTLTDGAASGEVTLTDQDWFKFEAERGEAITVTATTQSNPDSGSISVYLRDPGNGLVDRNLRIRPDDPVEKIGGIAERTGTYYVLVDGFDGETNGYSFEVDTRRTDAFEPNQGRDNLAATPLYATASEGYGSASGEITLTDQDWFAFDAEPGERISVSVSAANNVGSGEINAYIEDSNGDRLNSSRAIEPGETVSLTGTTDKKGTHFVFLDNYDDGTNEYSVSVTVDGEPAHNTFYGPSPVGESDEKPVDVDTDGQYENINGDEKFDVVDVQLIFVNRNDPTVRSVYERFDFNRDDELDVVDIQKLFVELTSN